MVDTKQDTTATELAGHLNNLALHLDDLGVVPVSLKIGPKEIAVHVRGRDLDAVGERFNGSEARRYGTDNIERVGTFGGFRVEVYGSARGYDEARNVCTTCGQVAAVSQ